LSKRTMLATAALVAIAALVPSPQAAQARVTWCLTDLGPMARRAEETGRIPQHVLDKEVSVPIQAVSTAKGGDNDHK